MTTVTPETLPAALEMARSGRIVLYVPTCTRVTKIDAKTIARFDAAGAPVLRPSKDGQGIMLRSGKGSVYLFPGQLLAEEA